jgi:hypothetical protein
MHQAAATYWNQIAAQQPLATEWAEQMFPLPQEELDKALDREEERVAAEAGGDRVVAAAYLKVMPLLWERRAISNYLQDNPTLRGAMPPLESRSEAILIASKDFQLSRSQLEKLSTLLKKPPI